MFRIGKSIKTKSRLMVAKRWGKGKTERKEGAHKGYGVSFWDNENVRNLIVVMTAQFCEYIKTIDCIL